MIDKETLWEKIKTGQTIYRLAGSQIREIKLDHHFMVGKANLLGDVHVNHAKFAFDTLYKNKEEAEWELEFGNITRTEKLELPTWEEFYNGKTASFDYRDRDCVSVCHLDKRGDYISFNVSGLPDFTKKLKATKENYIKACRLCKKLFLDGVA